MSDVHTGAAPAAPDAAAIATPQTVSDPMEAITRTMGEAYDKINPPREPSGEFKPKDTPAAEGAAPSDTATTESTDQTQALTPEPAKPAIEAPVSWSAEMKAKWATLPPDVQAYASQRESEAHKRISELGQTAKFLEPVRSTIERHSATFQRYGVDASTGIDQLMAYFAQSETDPRGFIENFARQKGIDLNSQPAGDQNDYVRSLESRVARAEKIAAEAYHHTTAREKSEQDKAFASLASIVEAFSSDPSRKPDWAEVETDVLGQLQAINLVEPQLAPEKKLEKAYDAARWANPTIRARLLDEQRKTEETKRAEEAKKRADEARKNASLNVKSANGASSSRKGNWEDTLRATGERLLG